MRTALFISCEKNQPEIRGMDPTVMRGYEFNPLMETCNRGHLEVVGVLLNHGGLDLDHQDFEGRTALSLT